MADGLTLPDLLAELARHGLRVASVTMAGGSVAAFTAVPADGRTAAPALVNRSDDEPTQSSETDALEKFLSRKDRPA